MNVALRVIGCLAFLFSGCFCLLCLLAGMLGASMVFGVVVLAGIYLMFGAPHLIQFVKAFPKTESRYDGSQIFVQTGGIWWGRSFWFASGWATVPFAQLRVSQDALVLSVMVFRRKHIFTVPRASVRRLAWKHVPFGLGLQIQHVEATCPPFLLFWVTDREALARSLKEFGYEMPMT